jgi:hypothetical protein
MILLVDRRIFSCRNAQLPRLKKVKKKPRAVARG